MKIKVLWHCEQQIPSELFRSLRFDSDEQPVFYDQSAALLEDIPAEQVRIFKSLECTRQLIDLKDNKFLYMFDYLQLNDFIVHNENKGLTADYNSLNELRTKTAALGYEYPESYLLYGIDLTEPKIMAILNVTPDSFSDGGRYLNPDDAYQHAMQLINAGAHILDIGGESSRPGAQPVTVEEELARVLPVIQRIRKKSDITISIDTCKAQVAQHALMAGANWINDISGLQHDHEMVPLARKWKCPVVVMHMRGTPRTMQKKPAYNNVITDLLNYFSERINYLKDADITKIIVDPGIGFGKRLEDNLYIIRHLRLFKQFGYPVLIGTSRKSFIGQITGKETDEREAGSLATAAVSVQNGATIIRAHEVAAIKDTISMIRHLSR